MFTRTDDKITTAQTIVIISCYMLGSGVLTLPRTLTERVKSADGWISIILGGLIIMLAGICIVKLCEQFPGKTIYQFVKEIVGSWIGSCLSTLMILYVVAISAFQIRVMAEVTMLYLLEGTPIWAIVMSFMWIGLYLITSGINSIARLFEIILPITIVVLLICLFLSSRIFDIDNLRPVLGEGIFPVLKGLRSTTLVFIGYEIMFILPAFMQYPKKGVKAMIIGTSIPLVLYIITFIMVVGALSVDGVVRSTWPTLDLMRSFEITGLLFERFEFFLLVIWIMQIFSTYTISFYVASLGLAQLSKKNIQPFMYGLIPIIFIVALLPKNMNEVFNFGDFIGIMSYLFMLLPVLLLLITKIFKKGAVKEDE
ncbi:GerAB/ArcD/ProY family transporter [Paenibacillus sp. IHBB 10380]|uniref:GerAB/ArcD/ProY family transporter n=1 Tax=Paenibacillus sp. IHBB 10380 TaxID=1566358 RepID=UPI0005CF9EB6|nr:GerAB/ArcD/ProY family transporter [Paenibacillus sp. IHBB 10380]AJS58837.1 spore gernimation protein [Paenibacillus sp. IHBB 10380]